MHERTAFGPLDQQLCRVTPDAGQHHGAGYAVTLEQSAAVRPFALFRCTAARVSASPTRMAHPRHQPGISPATHLLHPPRSHAFGMIRGGFFAVDQSVEPPVRTQSGESSSILAVVSAAAAERAIREQQHGNYSAR